MCAGISHGRYQCWYVGNIFCNGKTNVCVLEEGLGKEKAVLGRIDGQEQMCVLGRDARQ